MTNTVATPDSQGQGMSVSLITFRSKAIRVEPMVDIKMSVV